MIGMSQFIPLKGLHFVKAINAIIAVSLQKSKYRPVKGTEAKRVVCPGCLGGVGAFCT